MKLPYGYVLNDEEIVIHEERAGVVSSIFKCYLAGASLGKIVDMLFAKGIPSPTENPQWTRAAVDKLLANKKYVPIVGMEVYLDAQFEKNRRCNSVSLSGNEINLYKSHSFCYTCRKRESMAMTEVEISELYTRLAFRYEASIDSLLARRIYRYGPCYYIEREVL